ncbi:hypothetical protein [Mesorhizobium sp.]|uniref:hypothetical protein n=1 Tax=Mesorhizobium sp. TaxID=1871066 RepID=UPI000FE51D6C|nr:hypothetical protein [Mesorhizobium sp.]RWK57084.1 MAG: hypothetical protein EOR49_34195 [Mesorhizobium sp.]RWM45044.1 MAG: hypothetical protein EOR76_22030 [Mesorhizobium sp.]RWM53187.1 MAG: hypothetical protein EOR78_20150 [Mesorhizobium sp.]RWM62492.1 MAG: hypothetical protein EOR79_02895 [Mesorhizobium sp.]RWN00161.1 MAG: hypothetical protein EOR85_16525 [Mesorhizobium sp.]
MTKLAKASNDQPEAAETASAPVYVDPKNVTVNYEGFAWRDLFIRLPATATADHLKDPDIWRKVQGVQVKSLRRFDRLLIVAYDESWCAEAMVDNADNLKAVLTKPRIHALGTRFDGLYEDDTYRVVWNGGGFCVQRKADKHIMTSAVANAMIAQADVARLYPRVV